MTTVIPLAVLIEANECLKLARAYAPTGFYVRFLGAQCALNEEITRALADQVVEVQS